MTDNDNMYQSPQSDLSKPGGPTPVILASRISRLGAAIVDGLLAMAITLPVMSYLGIIEMTEQGQTPGLSVTIFLAVFGIVVFFLLHGYLLQTQGKTIGKKLFGITIVDLNGNILPLGKLIGLRYVPIWIAGYVPLVGVILVLLDVLYIFRQDRRCIHDLIAGTRVIVRQ